MADVPLTDEARVDLRKWLTDPEREPVLDLIREWPPNCMVTSHEDTPLMVPAPGVVGHVVSYFETGTLGVVAPMAKTLTSPITGKTARKGELIQGECDPASLVFLEEAGVTRADVAEILDG